MLEHDQVGPCEFGRRHWGGDRRRCRGHHARRTFWTAEERIAAPWNTSHWGRHAGRRRCGLSERQRRQPLGLAIKWLRRT